MCFYNDSDFNWYARVQEVTRNRVCQVSRRCRDCSEEIPAGTRHLHVFLQEYEECQTCIEEEGLDDCECGDPDYGETDDISICRPCQAFRAAVRRLERAEGCPAHAQEPLYGELYESVGEHDEAEKYWAAALRMFPSLKDHPEFVRWAPEKDDE